MDLIFWLFAGGFTIGILALAAAFGSYQAIQDRLGDIADELRKSNIELARELDRKNMKLYRRDVELEKLHKEQRQAHFEANAEKVLIKEKNPSSDR